MAERIHILIADDHAVVREGLRSLIATEPDMQLIGEASDGVTAVRLFAYLQPDVTLLDLIMPRKDGITAIREIRLLDPQARILVLTSFAEDDKVLPAIKAGAAGYLLKDSTPEELLNAVRKVHRGESFLDPAIARKVLHEFNRLAGVGASPDPLSGRELEVLTLIARGLSNLEIAGRLVISERTVRNHVGNILAKLRLANRTQAALYAIRHGLAGQSPQP